MYQHLLIALFGFLFACLSYAGFYGAWLLACRAERRAKSTGDWIPGQVFEYTYQRMMWAVMILAFGVLVLAIAFAGSWN